MLQVNRLHLPLPQSRVIQEWLSQPGAREFIRVLEFRDAELTAEAGNKLAEADGDDSNLAEAKLKAKEAGQVRALINLLQETRNPDYQFSTNTIEPQTSTQETTP